MQAGGEEVADGALAQGAEQGGLAGVAAADAADANLGDVFPLPQGHRLAGQRLALLLRRAVRAGLPRLSWSR